MKVKYEEYWNDFCRKNREASFKSLDELEEWIFRQMQRDYVKDPHAMYFPTPEILKYIGERNGPGRIEFMPEYGGRTVWIHMITDNRGIIFSDGTFTSGQKHWSREVQDWLRHCDERKKAPEFQFVD